MNLVGVINTALSGLPHLPRGGSVIVTGSLAALLKGGIGEMVLFLASDASRYVTGPFIAVDAGGGLKVPE